MGKADKLKSEAQRTGRGIFAGIKALEDSDAAGEGEVLQSNDIEKEQKTTVTVNEVEEKKTSVESDDSPIEQKVEENQADVAEVQASSEVEESGISSTDAAVNETMVIKEEINNTSRMTKNKSEKSGSRYEKDKFLLLDIRGYRDYVEHMAKAANMSATKYIRNLIEMDKRKNNEIYEAHKALEEKLRGTWQS